MLASLFSHRTWWSQFWITKSARSKALIASVALALIAAIFCAPTLWYGAPNGGSIDHNLVWLAHFSSQLAQGDLYPRWLMDMNRGAGSPVFYFYGPMPFYLASVPALLLSQSPLTIQLAWGEWLLIAASGITFSYYARARFNASAAFVCSVLYMALPYHFEIDLWRRQDIGELASYIWMPLVLHYTDRLFEHKSGVAGLAVSYALLVLSHLPAALLFSICLGVYVLTHLWSRHALRDLLRFAAAISTGLLLCGLYLVPALFTQHYVLAELLWSPAADARIWLFPIGETLRQYPGHSVFASRLLMVVGISTAIFALCWLSALRWRDAIGSRNLVGCAVLVGIAWFLMSSLSLFVWQNAPQLWKVQFPWRIAMVVDLAAALAALYAVHCIYTYRDWISGIAFSLSVISLIGTVVTANVFGTLDPFFDREFITKRDNYVRDGLDAPEYTTAWNPNKPLGFTAAPIQGKIVHDPSSGIVTVTQWSPRIIEMSVSLQNPTSINVRQFYYPNWRAETDNDVELNVVPSEQNGLIEIALPAGEYRLRLQLEPLLQEFIGAGFTAFGLLLLLSWSSIRWIRAVPSGKTNHVSKSRSTILG